MKNTLLLFIGLFACTTLFCMEDDEEKYQQGMLHQYADQYSEELVRLIESRLKSGKTLEVKDNHAETPFIAALRVGNTKAAKAFIDAGCNYNLSDRDGKNAMNLAAQAGDIETVKALLARNVSFDKQDKSGDTPLHSVTQRGQWLNQPYAEIELKAYQAICADLILCAAQEKYICKEEQVLVNKAFANQNNLINGWPSDEVVRAMDRLEMNKIKGSENVDHLLTFANKEGRTPVELACWRNPCVLSVFFKHGAPIHPDFVSFMAEDHLRCMRLLRAEIARNNHQRLHIDQVFGKSSKDKTQE